ncbi:MAG: hypothetical protein Q8L64_06215 [bacterium]|nr:hypothetical protein [bacterium]
MASWSTKRKYGYFAAAIGLLVIFVGIPTFFALYEAPTCFDGRQNGGERGVDCGGKCQRLCAADFAPPRVLWTYSMRVVPGVYNAIAYVQNPNPSAEASKLPYTMKLYDAEGILVSQRTGTAYVPAGARFPVFEGGIQTGSRVPTRTTFEFADNPQWQPAEQINILSRLTVDVIEGPKPSAEAKIRNVSVNLSAISMDAFLILYDETDNRIAFSKTVIDSIAPGEIKTLYFTWAEPFPRKVVRSELLFVPSR